MVSDLKYWADLYNKYKYEAVCVDIETEGVDKPITVITFYTPKEGPIEVVQLVKGKDLNSDAIRDCLKSCKLLITYNGKKHDIPKILKEFPGSVPVIPNLDLFLFSLNLGVFTGLKTLEQHHRIERLDNKTQRKGIAVKLWRNYSEFGREDSLQMLLEYNKQDAINLFPLAEELVSMVQKGERYSDSKVDDYF